MHTLADDATSDGTSVRLAELIALRQEAGRLQIAPRGKVLATRSGGHLSRFRGRGMEYDESRIYTPGDDPRNMDWRVTARSGSAHVKLFREERERPVWLLVDMGRYMRFGTRVAFKSVIAARAAALLAWAAVDKGDRVGGLVYDEQRLFERRPAARSGGVLPLLNAISKVSDVAARQGLVDADEGFVFGPGLESFSAAATRLVAQVRSGSLVFLISDFTGIGRQDDTWLARLGAGNEVVFVHVHDVLEAEPPPAGRYPVTDGTRQTLIDSSVVALRDAWAKRFSERQSLLQAIAHRHRAHLISLRTDQPLGQTLHEGLQPRQRRSGGIR